METGTDNWERRPDFGCFGEPWTPLENPLDGLICNPSRTNNRIRSSRLAASSLYMNVDKGSWQNISITSGKELALRVGPRGICINVATARGDYGKICRPSGRSFGGVEDESFGNFSQSQLTSSSELDSEKWNPTV